MKAFGNRLGSIHLLVCQPYLNNIAPVTLTFTKRAPSVAQAYPTNNPKPAAFLAIAKAVNIPKLFAQITKTPSGILKVILIPIVAILLGLLDGEQINSQHYIGVTVILSGIYIINKK